MTLSAPSATASTTSNTGTSWKCWCTIPIPASIAWRGSVKCARLAVDEDLARVRLVEAGQDVHQGGLAGAVLAEQAEHLAAVDRDRDAVVGEHAREALGDVLELEAHGPPPTTPDTRCARLGRPEAGRVVGSVWRSTAT